MAIDPVCKMKVDPEKAAAKAEYQGQTYYFCAPGCKAAFEKDPAKFLEAVGGGEGHQHHGH
jgi:Cu+-exporting ATPase